MRSTKEKRYDEAYIRMAVEWAKLSHAKRAQVGAIIVKDRTIISDGFNGAPSGFSNICEDDNNKTFWYVLHAEANAILKCSQSTNSCKDSTLYVTLSPCKECAKLILQAGIKTVIYKELYRDSSGVDFLKQAGIQIFQV